MAPPIRRISAKQLYEQISSNPTDSIIIEESKPKDSNTKWRASFAKNTFNVKISNSDEAPTKINAIIENTGLIVVSPPSDPNDEKSMYAVFNKDNEKSKNELRISVSGNHSGDYVNLIRLFNKERDERIPKMVAEKMLGVGWKGQKNNDMIKHEYGEHAKDKAGQHYKDPLDPTKDDVRIPLTIDFTINSQNSKENKGLPKTLIYDARTYRIVNDEHGNPVRIDYDLAMVEGKPLDMNNCHKFITNGSELIECDISIDTTSKSGQGISTKQVIKRAVVNPKEQIRIVEAPKNLDILGKLQKLRGGANAPVAESAAPKSSVESATNVEKNTSAVAPKSSVESASNAEKNTSVSTPDTTAKNKEISINNLLSGLDN